MLIAPSKKKNLKDKCLTVLEDDQNVSIQCMCKYALSFAIVEVDFVY
jgi:hypothetical protein